MLLNKLRAFSRKNVHTQINTGELMKLPSSLTGKPPKDAVKEMGNTSAFIFPQYKHLFLQTVSSSSGKLNHAHRKLFH